LLNDRVTIIPTLLTCALLLFRSFALFLSPCHLVVLSIVFAAGTIPEASKFIKR